MASAHQLKALLRAHIDKDDTHFLSVAMQVAAHEAKRGHGKHAAELRELVEEAKAAKIRTASPTPLVKPRGDLSERLSVKYT